jgi:L-arabinose isomerase
VAAQAVGCMKGGQAVFVNLAPIAGDRLRLIVSPVTMLDTKGREKIRNSVRGWFKPAVPVSGFLEQYSRAGGTHHAALVYGDCAGEILSFGELMNWDVVAIG